MSRLRDMKQYSNDDFCDFDKDFFQNKTLDDLSLSSSDVCSYINVKIKAFTNI